MTTEEMIAYLENGENDPAGLHEKTFNSIVYKLRAAEELAAYCRGFDGSTWSTMIVELARDYDKAGT